MASTICLRLTGAIPTFGLARAYEIHAWPTTVTIDADGEIRTRLGVDRDLVVALTRGGRQTQA